MKSERIDREPPQTKNKYPSMFHNKQADYIVLAISDSTGTVIDSGSNRTYSVGHYSNFWINFNNTDHWAPYYGTVKITDE